MIASPCFKHTSQPLSMKGNLRFSHECGLLERGVKICLEARNENAWEWKNRERLPYSVNLKWKEMVGPRRGLMDLWEGRLVRRAWHLDRRLAHLHGFYWTVEMRFATGPCRASCRNFHKKLAVIRVLIVLFIITIANVCQPSMSTSWL